MTLAITQVVLSIFAMMVIGLWATYDFSRRFKGGSTRLFDDGYILTHPQRDAVAFACAAKANEFAARARESGVYFEIYGVYRGNITHCGNTVNVVIS